MCLPFRTCASISALFIRWAKRTVPNILATDDDARVKMPTKEDLEQYNLAISLKYQSLKDLYAVEDRLMLFLEQSGYCIIQKDFIIVGLTTILCVVLYFLPGVVLSLHALSKPL